MRLVRRWSSVALIAVLGACGGEVSDSTLSISSDDEARAENSAPLSFTGTDLQFAEGFAPRNAPFGGFGGGRCRASRTPVIYLPGNGDDAKNFDFPPSVGGLSPYDSLVAAGYRDCEIFGVNWLEESRRKQPLLNYHDAQKALIVKDFILDVLAYTGRPKVDIIGHSMGVTLGLATLEEEELFPKIRRFVAISGAMRGLGACWTFGNANPLFPVCGSQNYIFPQVFGLFPDTLVSPNWRMGAAGFRDFPKQFPGTRFYAITAGKRDGFICGTNSFTPDCDRTARFDTASNVRAQLDVGVGSTADQIDFDWTDYTVFKAGAGDIDGVGHFRAKNNTGRVQANMLTTECSGTACCRGYDGGCGL